MKSFRLHFNTVTEMVGYNRKHPSNSRGWGQAPESLCQKFLSGDESYVASAEQYLDKLNDILPETLRNEWHADVFGPVISVPDYLSNSPLPFRRERVSESSCAPIRIVASLTSSAGVSHEHLKERGIVILALLMKLQQVRPVDLILYCEMDCDGYNTGMGIASLNIESRPLSIAHALVALSDSMIARQIFYNCISAEAINRKFRGSAGGWPEGFVYGGNNTKYFEQVKKEFGMTDGELYIPPTYLTDPIVNKPLEWLNENLQKLIHFED